MKVNFVVIILATIVSGGDVDFEVCGGDGNINGIRIDGCEGSSCNLEPGNVYTCEGDIYPSVPVLSLTLKVNLILRGRPSTLVEAVLPNSSVQPGFMYTIRFNLVPNDLPVCQDWIIEIQILHTSTEIVEICGRFNATSSCGN